jgi:hypothetical protein
MFLIVLTNLDCFAAASALFTSLIQPYQAAANALDRALEELRSELERALILLGAISLGTIGRLSHILSISQSLSIAGPA